MQLCHAEEYLKIAYPMCLEIPRQKKHVSLVVCKKRIIAVGMNYFKTHPMAGKIGYRYGEMHSELDAFRKLDREGVRVTPSYFFYIYYYGRKDCINNRDSCCL